MVEFIARGYEPRKKTETQQPANCRVGWPNKGWSKEKKFANTCTRSPETVVFRSPAPDHLVRDLFQYRIRTTTSFQCAEGLRLEPVIKDKYVEYQLNHGHLGLSA